MRVDGVHVSVWAKYRQERKAKLEGRRKAMIEEVTAVLDTLSEKYAWDEAYLLGSLTRPGRFGPESDVDIAMAGLSKFDHYALVGDISNLLDRAVDVVRLEECPFAAKIAREGIPWKKTQGR